MNQKFISSIEDIIKDLREGKMVIMVDDEDRENEGDLIIPAQKVDDQAINFMATHGRGLICLTLTEKRIQELNLPLMSQNNDTRDTTAFTISIEAKEGVTTGISAQDRAVTIHTAINDNNTKDDIMSPGHVFPLVARDGGVLVRAGHTEASVDLSRLAGFIPAGVICEIMNDDGTMARVPDLIKFSEKHNIKIGKIVDLIAYRRQKDNFLNKSYESKITLKSGEDFDIRIYESNYDKTEQIVLSKGKIDDGKPVLIRVHVTDYFENLLGDYGSNDESLRKSINLISREGRGILILVRDSGSSALSQLAALKDEVSKDEKSTHEEKSELRIFGMGAQILSELGVKKMILLTNTDWKFIGLEAYNIEIVETRLISELN
jgi:3,4-dihydroxy 2-butanone 4-phosphate synthase/GTP cyclohydrolase II